MKKYLEIGIFEFLFALYPILIYYSYGIAYAGDFLLIAMGMYALFVKRKSLLLYRPLLFLLIYIFIHELLLLFVLEDIPGYFFNATIVMLLNFILIMCIVPALNADKLYNSLMLVGIFCMLGMIYHFVYIYFLGQQVSPLQLPFMPALDDTSRYANEIVIRPTSFFPEPAAYVVYMMVPLAWSLMRKNIFLALLISLTILLSTSSNGFFQVFLLWIFYVLTLRKVKMRFKVSVFFLIVIMFWAVNSSSFFEAGISKIEDTEFGDNVRVTAGFNFYKNLPVENKILGVNAPNLSDYVKSNPETIRGFAVDISKSGAVYFPVFWVFMSKFGLIGGLLLLYLFLSFYKYEKLRIYVFICLVSMFVQSLGLVYPLVFMLTYRQQLLNSKRPVIKNNLGYNQ